MADKEINVSETDTCVAKRSCAAHGSIADYLTSSIYPTLIVVWLAVGVINIAAHNWLAMWNAFCAGWFCAVCSHYAYEKKKQ